MTDSSHIPDADPGLVEPQRGADGQARGIVPGDERRAPGDPDRPGRDAEADRDPGVAPPAEDVAARLGDLA